MSESLQWNEYRGIRRFFTRDAIESHRDSVISGLMFLPSNHTIYLALGSTDMRKAINGLSILVEQQLQLNPFSGNLFAFCNRLNTIIKILYWDHNGFCLWTKRLEKQKFKWPRCDDDIKTISTRELQWLLAGLDLDQPTAFSRLCYSTLT